MTTAACATQAPQIVESVNTITGSVYSVSRGYSAGTIVVSVKTEHGISSIALSANCARDYVVDSVVVLQIGEVR